MKIQIITDSASDIVNPGREDLTVLPMTITFGETEYLDGINLSHSKFYEKLVECDDLPTTSQISPYDFSQAIRKVTEAGDMALVITLSSKLSGTYQSACIAAQEFEGKAFVVDSMNVTVGEHALIEYALRLKDSGMDIQDIVAELENSKKNIQLIALLDTLEYLKKGGRISKTVAFAGNVLSIKPVVGVVDGEVAMLGKARGSKHGNNLLAEHIKKVGGIDFSKPYFLGYTGLSDALIQKYIKDSEALWNEAVKSLPITTVGGTIGTHVGPGAIAVAFFSHSVL
ncbi:MAG: DegV family protein [Clostridium sp.]|nr:DegV family protein [Clostridium sp.]